MSMKKRMQILVAILALSITSLPVSAQPLNSSNSESTADNTTTCSIGTVDWWSYEMTYEDVKTDDWFYNDVKNVSLGELMTGLDSKTFAPNDPLARAQFAKIIYREAGTPDVEYQAAFPDVSDNEWYTNAIIWANSKNIVTGYTDTGMFGVNDNITREQLAVMMLRYDNICEPNYYKTDKRADLSKFQDGSSVSSFAKDAMGWAVERKLIQGKDNGTRLDPQGNASRAECAAILSRYWGYISSAQ